MAEVIDLTAQEDWYTTSPINSPDQWNSEGSVDLEGPFAQGRQMQWTCGFYTFEQMFELQEKMCIYNVEIPLQPAKCMLSFEDASNLIEKLHAEGKEVNRLLLRDLPKVVTYEMVGGVVWNDLSPEVQYSISRWGLSFSPNPKRFLCTQIFNLENREVSILIKKTFDWPFEPKEQYKYVDTHECLERMWRTVNVRDKADYHGVIKYSFEMQVDNEYYSILPKVKEVKEMLLFTPPKLLYIRRKWPYNNECNWMDLLATLRSTASTYVHDNVIKNYILVSKVMHQGRLRVECLHANCVYYLNHNYWELINKYLQGMIFIN